MPLKVHKDEIILNFFWPKSNPYMPFVNLRKKFRFFSFDFISMFEHFRGDWAYAEPNFFDDLSRNFFFKIFTLVQLDGFLDGYWKFWLFIVKICILIVYFSVLFENYSMLMLSIRGTDFIAHMLSIRKTNFIAHWAYAERISLHAEHARNRFHRMVSMRGNG